jgi:hypothetical protein
MLSRLDVRELYERSTHGKSNRCDKIGEIVKVRFVEVTRLGELLARNKAVHAFVAQKIEANVDMQLQMDPITQRLFELRRYLILCSFREPSGLTTDSVSSKDSPLFFLFSQMETAFKTAGVTARITSLWQVRRSGRDGRVIALQPRVGLRRISPSVGVLLEAAPGPGC